MMSPFDALAPAYDALWTDTPRGRGQRLRVWQEVDSLFRAGDHVLDLGCGTGDDAIHLMQRGVEVYAIDASRRMAEIAQERGVRAQRLAIEDLDRLAGPFSGALSNFGALNCVADLRPVAEQLARLVVAQGPVAICLMGRICWPEIARGNMRRWRGRVQWRGMEVRYPLARQVRAAFAEGFDFERRVAIGGGDHQFYIFRRRKEC